MRSNPGRKFSLLRFAHPVVSHPDSKSNPIGGSEPVSECETIYWDSLPDFFFFNSRSGTCGYGPHLITKSKSHIHKQKNYHRSGVHQNLHPFTESHLQIQNCPFTITNQSTEPTCSEPLQVCWPCCMRMFADVFSYTYTDLKTRAKLYA